MYRGAEEHAQRLTAHHSHAHAHAQHPGRRGSRPTSASSSTLASTPAPGTRIRHVLAGAGTRPGATCPVPQAGTDRAGAEGAVQAGAEGSGEQQQQGLPRRQRTAKPSRSLGEGSLGSLVARTLRQLSFPHRKSASTLPQPHLQHNQQQQQQAVGAVEGPARCKSRRSSLDRPSQGVGQGPGSERHRGTGHGSTPASPVPNGWKAGALTDGRPGSRTAGSRQHSSHDHPYQQQHLQQVQPLSQQHRQIGVGEEAGLGSFGGPGSLGREGHLSTLLGHWAHGSGGPTGTGTGTGGLNSTSHTHIATPTARALLHPHGPASSGQTSAFHRASGSVAAAAAANATTTTSRTQARWAAPGAARAADHHDALDTAALLNTLDTQHDSALNHLFGPHGDPQPGHVPLPGPHHLAPSPQPHSSTRSVNPRPTLHHHTNVPIGGEQRSSARNGSFLHDANDPLATSTWTLMAERTSWRCPPPVTEPAALGVGPGAATGMQDPRPGVRVSEVFGLETEDQSDQAEAVHAGGMVRRCGSATAVRGTGDEEAGGPAAVGLDAGWRHPLKHSRSSGSFFSGPDGVVRQEGAEQGGWVGGRQGEEREEEAAGTSARRSAPTVMLVVTGSGQGPDSGSVPPAATSGPQRSVRQPTAGPGVLASTSTVGLLTTSMPSVPLPSGGATVTATDTTGGGVPRSGANPHPHLYPPRAVGGLAHDLPPSIMSPTACASPVPTTPTSRVLLFASSLRSASVAGLGAGPGPPRTFSTSTQDQHVGSSRLMSAGTSFSSPMDATATGSGSANTGVQGQGQGPPIAPSDTARTQSQNRRSSVGPMQYHPHQQQQRKDGAGEVDGGSAVPPASPGPGRTSASMTLPVSPFPGVLVGPRGSFTGAAAAATAAADNGAAAAAESAAEARTAQADAGQQDLPLTHSGGRQEAKEEAAAAGRAEPQQQHEQGKSSAPAMTSERETGAGARGGGYDLALPYDTAMGDSDSVPYSPDGGGGGATADMYGEAGHGGGAMNAGAGGLGEMGAVGSGADEEPDVAWHEFSAVRALDPVSGLPVLVLTQVG